MTPTYWARKGAVLVAISNRKKGQDSRHWFLSSSSALPLISCVTLEKSLTFSEPQLTLPQNGDNSILPALPLRIMGEI